MLEQEQGWIRNSVQRGVIGDDQNRRNNGQIYLILSPVSK
jgi:hypothetical protein